MVPPVEVLLVIGLGSLVWSYPLKEERVSITLGLEPSAFEFF